MKDKQTPTKPQLATVPVLSPLLHVLCMPVLVFMRWNFGFSFLRPKSIFIALSWAFLLYVVYAVYTEPVWVRRAGTVLFGLVAMVLYFLHLGVASFSQLRSDPQHDNYAGTSWIRSEHVLSRILVEPAIIFVTALLLEWLEPSAPVSYLKLVAICLFLKEGLNHWYNIRKAKLQRDILDDASDQIGKAAHNRPTKAPSTKTTRKQRIQRKRIRIAQAIGEEEVSPEGGDDSSEPNREDSS